MTDPESYGLAGAHSTVDWGMNLPGDTTWKLDVDQASAKEIEELMLHSEYISGFVVAEIDDTSPTEGPEIFNDFQR